MKRWQIALIAVGGVVLVLLLIGGRVIGWRNRLVDLDENVKSAWANVENQLQRRADLVPNLVETVKGYASHEREVLTAVTEARAKVGGATTPQEKIKANQQLTSALSRLLLVVERYPDLKASANFRALQDELAGTENRIAVERRRYNEAARTLNSTRRKFPYLIFAGSFDEAPYFEAEEGAEKAPKVQF